MNVYDLKDCTKYPYHYLRRFLELLVTVPLVVVTSPIVLLAMLAIRLESKGSVLYAQERYGHLGKVIKIYKLRSMYEDAEKHGAKWAVKGDSRVTRVGKFIRKTRIDELPQLWLVLKGDMSLIGPRPERPILADEFVKEIPDFHKRLTIKPGLTGLAQVNGGYELTPAEKLKWDLNYIQNYNAKLDTFVVLKTVKIVFTGDGAY